MTVKQLIWELLSMPMDSKVKIAVQNEGGDFMYYTRSSVVYHEVEDEVNIVSGFESKED